ncbi:MAG: GNAT family N-acetyltransferase [Bacteroidota bacterium]
MRIQAISPEETLEVRATVLRPGWAPMECLLSEDADPTSLHIGAINETGAMIGVASFYPVPLKSHTGNGFQLRQMGVLPDYRRQGFASGIFREGIRLLKEQAATYVWCNARQVALPFYQAEGMEFISDVFEVPKIGPHRRMLLNL